MAAVISHILPGAKKIFSITTQKNIKERNEVHVMLLLQNPLHQQKHKQNRYDYIHMTELTVTIYPLIKSCNYCTTEKLKPTKLKTPFIRLEVGLRTTVTKP